MPRWARLGVFRKWTPNLSVPEDTHTRAGTSRSPDGPHSENAPKELRDVAIHGGPVTSVVFLADGKHIVAGCKDGSIQRWSLSDCRELQPSMCSNGAVKAVATSPDEKWIVSGGTDCMVTVWNAVTHEKVGETLQLHGNGVTALDISSDSSYFAVGSEDGSVILSGLEGGERVGSLLGKQEARISSVKFSPRGDRLASACTVWDCCSIRIWRGHTGNLLACLSVDNKPTYSLAWSNDGQQLFAGGPRGSIKGFNIATLSMLSGFGDPRSDAVTSLSLSNNDRFLVASSASGCSLNIWDVDTCHLIHSVHLSSELLTVAISPDSFYLVSGGMDKKISVRNIRDDISMSYFFHRLTPFLRYTHSEAFTYMSKAVHEAWTKGDLAKAETILSEEIRNPDYPKFVPYLFANRALVRARLHAWDKALEDTQMKPDDTLAPLLVYIARALALFGKGNHSEGAEAIDLVLRDCHDNARPFIELIKFVLLFEVEHNNEREVIEYDIDPVDSIVDIKPIRSVVKAQMLVLLAQRAMAQQDYQKAIHLLTLAQDLGPFMYVPELQTISIVFGWNLDGLSYTIQQEMCHSLFADDRLREAIHALLAMQSDPTEVTMTKEMCEWVDGFRKQCLESSESLGEAAMCNAKHDEAVDWYSVALDLNPTSPEHVFMKRSKAFAARESWEDALMDANKVIALNPCFPQVYDMKCRMLHNLGRYDEIVRVLDELPEGLRDQRAYPKEAIREILKKTLHDVPLRLIDTKTGRLCEETEMRRAFEGDPVFWDLRVSATEYMDIARIEHAVQEFFQYVMFSHKWQDREPLYSDVGDQSVYSLSTEGMPTVIKLQKFCRTACDAGFRWAWSDTCCIDQTNQREFEKSINSMFRWYHNSSLTLVYLSDVLPSSLPGRLILCTWITRGWTLQELLAPTVIRFFNNDWTPYLFDSPNNHKESKVIMEEIAQAVGVSANDLLSFHPSSDDVYWKLRMASKRETTMPEDAAYCLYGIFSVIMSIIPGETQQQAIGRLLREIIRCSKSGDVGCLAWIGEPSELNSCLPAQIGAYQTLCHTPASITEEMIQESVAELASPFSNEDERRALAFYDTLVRQPRAEFNGWRLRLPCILFRVTFQVDRRSDMNVYTARADELEPTEICTTDRLPKGSLLACPWIHELVGLTPLHGLRDTESSVGTPSGHPADVQGPSADEGPERSIRSHRHDDHSLSGHLRVHHENSGPPTPASIVSTLPQTPIDERTRALRLVACLRRPMMALLLSRQPHGVYKRIATDQNITIRLREEVLLDRISVKVVEII